MYPRIIKVTLMLPWQKPQVVIVRELLSGIYRLQLVDRFDRTINYTGTKIGFGVTLFESTYNQSYLVVQGNWEEVLYSSESDKEPQPATVLDIATDDC